ncbi:uncharacterized protein [Coffea arabica]|uniref:SWIM-type domain-containing protein n=1 Tax=Coffea arabica TaxID=13443 RepID=A0A6P6U8X3_COFAR|nr:uncharacterized protein LOC113708413 [Coffea arabica]
MTFQIKSYQPQHTCVMVKNCAKATSDWMVKKLVGVMRDHPNMTSKGVEAELRKYGVKPTKIQIFRAKNKALVEIEGTHAESYSKLPKYAELFRAQKLGFLEDCRPFVGFDGCFLKGPFGGVLMTAVALDANNSVFLIVFAGLNLAYEEIFPDAIGRHCYGHIYSNFKSQFPSILHRSFFWKVAKSYDVVGYNEPMASIKDINREAWKYLDKIPKSFWCRHVFSPQFKCDHVTNNIIESFNNWVSDLRGKLILTLVDGLRRKFMKNLHKRYQKGCTLTANITPRIAEKLTEISQASRKCEMYMASEDTFEIGDLDRSYIVVLSKKFCDCGVFQISRIPCKHAALGIMYRREKLEHYYEAWFTKDMYLKAYSAMIHPIPDVKRWLAMPDLLPKTVLPPPLRRAPGRPRVNQRREADKGASSSQPKRSSTLKCRNCGAAGHNKRAYKGPPVQKRTANRTPTELMTNRRDRPGRGMASTSLLGAVLRNYVCRGFQSLTNTLILRDHAEGNVPIVHSNQGSNPSPTDHNGGVNV